MSNLTEKLQAEFDAMRAKREEILKISTPMRAERDKYANEARAIEMKMNAEIKKIEKDLYQIDCDIATLARALGGRRMSDNIR